MLTRIDVCTGENIFFYAATVMIIVLALTYVEMKTDIIICLLHVQTTLGYC